MNSTNVAVIIPAYNEEKNLQILLKDIKAYLPNARIVVIDDSSVPMTMKFSSDVIYIARGRKMGRGSAVIRGLAEGLKHKDVQYFFEMDADLAHSPAEFGRFLVKREEADMVIGSRYMVGSTIVKWPRYRLVQSRIINFFLRYLLGLQISDFTNGFRLYSREVAEFLTYTPVKEKGFIALSEIAYKVQKRGFKIAEVPVTFKDREFGKSNANLRELLLSLLGAFRIRFS
jgi:dolichol-phosphate mannosyltransferase